MESHERLGAGSRSLLIAAAVVIVIAGLKAASTVLVPVLMAALVTVLCLPPMRWMQKRGVPDWASLPVIFLLMIGVAAGFSFLVGNEVAHFREELPHYREHLSDAYAEHIDALLAHAGFENVRQMLEELTRDVQVGKVFDVAGVAVGAITDILSNGLFVLLAVMFMVTEAAGFPRKLREAFSESLGSVSESRRAVRSIHDYVRVKTEVSLATGLLAFFLCLAFGVDSAVLWGILAFLLNFVPTIGSLVAAVPPILLAFAKHGWPEALGVTIGYAVINIVIGNVLEPRLMGRKLGLSSLVVFLSLVFWGWVWGPIGMLLSVPLTMLVKILLEQSEDLRWIAVLLGPGGEQIPTKDEDVDEQLAFATQTMDLDGVDVDALVDEAARKNAARD